LGADSQPSEPSSPSLISDSPLAPPAAESPVTADADRVPLFWPPAGDHHDHPVYRTLIELRGEIEGQRRLRSRDDILRLLSHAIGSHMDGWGDIIDALVVVLLPIEDRVTTKKRRGTPLEPGRTGPAEGLNRRQTISFFYGRLSKLDKLQVFWQSDRLLSTSLQFLLKFLFQ
jgi:hypothetical protein